MSSSKNIGQVVGLFIGTTPPVNTALIWYDETPNQLCHKIYNPTTKLWQVLNPDIISITTYSELVNNAQKNGLSVGKQYLIRDKNDILATVITPTKIHYVDTLGNILIDDLGTNVQYHVNSSNIYVDDIKGVLNPSSQLIFSFKEKEPEFDDFIFGKTHSNFKWELVKFKVKQLLSSQRGNSLIWQNGIFFNFSAAIINILNKKGGVVGKDFFDATIEKLSKAITNASKENQNIITTTQENINEATKDVNIYNKKLPQSINTAIEAADIQKSDTLFNIISKIQRWISKFKYATGIKLSKNFKEATTAEYINNNDTVESALGKIQRILKNPNLSFSLPLDWTDSDYVNSEMAEAGDDYNTVFAKLSGFVRNCISTIRLSKTLATSKYNAINSTKHLYDTNGELGDMLCQLDYNQYHINKDMINDHIIDYDKIAEKGVLATDVFRIDLTVNNFDFTGCAFGGIVIQGINSAYDKVKNWIFVDDNDVYNPYKFDDNYQSDGRKILSFAPIIPVIDGKTSGTITYSNSASFVHTEEEDLTFQVILFLKDSVLNGLQSSNKHYFNTELHVDAYGNITNNVNMSLSVSKKVIYNITISKDKLTGNKPHLILYLNITPSATADS